MVYCIQQLNRSITDNDRSEEKRVNENLKRKERDGKGGGWSIISISSPQKRKKRKEKIEKAAAASLYLTTEESVVPCPDVSCVCRVPTVLPSLRPFYKMVGGWKGGFFCSFLHLAVVHSFSTYFQPILE